MQELYTENDQAGIRSQLRRRRILIAALTLVFIAAAVTCFIRRNEPLTAAAVTAAGITLIFGLEMFCTPLRRYDALMEAALHGRSHTEELVFARPESQISLVDGIPCRSLVFLGESDKHGIRERMYYWDQEIPVPDFIPGRTYRIRYTDKTIVGWETDQGSSVIPPLIR